LALLAESQAIKQHLPPFNFAQKKTKVQPLYGLFIEHDADGYACLQIDRNIQNRKPFLYFDTKEEAKNSLRHLSTVYQLCLSKTSLNTGPGACFHYHIQKCKGACIGLENSLDYNQRVHAFASASNISTVDEIWKMKGRYAYEFGFIWLENGVLKGMGFASKSEQNINLETFEKHLEPLHFNRDIHRILLQFKWDTTIEKIEIRKQKVN
jgi:DNA polymerase-3 subunit epsilon